MRSRRLPVDPAIIHDAGPATLSSNRRYNKALMSDAACPIVLCMYIVGLIVITMKYPVGKFKHLFKRTNLRDGQENIKLFCFSENSVGISHLKTIVIQPCINCIVTPLFYYVFHKSTRQYYSGCVFTAIKLYMSQCQNSFPCKSIILFSHHQNNRSFSLTTRQCL